MVLVEFRAVSSSVISIGQLALAQVGHSQQSLADPLSFARSA